LAELKEDYAEMIVKSYKVVPPKVELFIVLWKLLQAYKGTIHEAIHWVSKMQGEEIKSTDKCWFLIKVKRTNKQNWSLKTKRTFVIRKGKKRAVEIG
jgi:hypothetical protein